jgi:hypothetical protein
MPEVRNNIDMTVGNLGLTDEEENLLVIAMQFTTDGFDPAHPTAPPGTFYKNSDTFTGQCMISTTETASTQGNSTLIPTPTPLTPCADAVCAVSPVPNPPIP